MTQALQTVLDHAEHQRDAALAAVLQAEEATRRLQQQAEQLLAYRDDYRLRHPAQGGRSASIELLRVHEGFMQRLDQALQQQRQQLEAAQARAASLRQVLVAQETRVAAVRKLLERRGEQARLDSNRLEQRRSDEARQARHRDEGASWRLATSAVPLSH